MKKLEWTDKELEEVGYSLQTFIYANKNRKEQSICKNCGNSYFMQTKNNIFCSTACRMNWNYKLRKQELKEYRELKEMLENGKQIEK